MKNNLNIDSPFKLFMVIKNVYRPVKTSEKDNIRKDTKIHGVSKATKKFNCNLFCIDKKLNKKYGLALLKVRLASIWKSI